MVKLIIIGAAGHAKVIADLVRLNSKYQVAGFIDTVSPARQGESFYGATVLGGEDALSFAKKQGITHAFPAFGANAGRVDWVQRLQSGGWTVPVLIYPGAIVSESASVGDGTAVMAGAIIQSDTITGNACIINTGALVDHDCNLGQGVHVAPGCSLAGHVDVGELSELGIGTVVRDRITIGKNVTTGSGSVVVTDLPDNCLAYGVPAKPVTQKS